MTMDLFQRAVDQAKEFPDRIKKFELYFFGEPLCNPLLPQMIAYARKADVAETIDFTTNGLLFSKEKVDELVANGMPDTIRISLQGLDEEAYFRIAGAKIDFNRMLENLRYLYQHKGSCKIAMKVADIALKKYPDGKERFEKTFGEVADTLFIETIIPIYADVDYNVLIRESGIMQQEDARVLHKKRSIRSAIVLSIGLPCALMAILPLRAAIS